MDNMDKSTNYFNVKSNEKMRMFVDGDNGLEGNYQRVILTVNNIVQFFGFLDVASLTQNTTPMKRIFRIAETYDYDVFDFSKLDKKYTEIDLHNLPDEWASMIGYLYTRNCFAEEVQHLINPREKHTEKYNDKYNFSCDTNIYNLMDTLNDLGYSTRFSCEGNIYSVKNNLFSEAYIKFSDEVDIKELITALEDKDIKYSSKNKKIFIDNIFPTNDNNHSTNSNLRNQLFLIDDGSYLGDFTKFSFLNNNLFISGEKIMEDCKFLTHTIITLPYSILQVNDHTVRFGMGFNLDALANLIQT